MRQNKTFDNHIFFRGFMSDFIQTVVFGEGGVAPIVEPVCPHISVKRAASMFSETDHHFRFHIKFT